VVPFGFHDPTRIAGLASEPADYGLFVAGYALPAVFAAWSLRACRPVWLLLLAAALLVTGVFTNSATGLMAVFVTLLIGLLLGPARALALSLCLGATGALAYFVESGEAWYLASQLTMTLQSEPTLSFTTRVFSTLGPLMVLSENPLVVIGFGLGGSSVHLFEVVPQAVAQQILEVSWEDAPTLKTLWGKILAETGIVGGILFAVFGLAAVRRALSASRLADDVALAHASRAAASGLLATLLIHVVGFGAYTFPYLWLLAGLCDGFGLVALRKSKG